MQHIASQGLVIAVLGLLVFATLIDVNRRIIPDTVCAAVLACGIAWLAVGPAGFNTTSLLAGLATLVFGTWAHYRRVLGGGDVKLLAALAFWLPPEMLTTFLLFGALGSLLTAMCVRVLAWRRPEADHSIPMAVAILAGFIAVIPRLLAA